ncbi:MAG TPA: DUF202 domain-containing protein [Thermomicrobiaceae bacterium]|nr:DUF202 domain-containing protein [Thermomicrobiaceae bacterium]
MRAAKALDYLANERTLVAWVRLGVTIIVLGFVVARFGIFLNQIAIQQRQPAIGPGFTLPIGVTLVLGGALLTVLAGVRFFRVEHDIEAERLRRRYLLIYALLAAGTLISIALAVYLILAQLTSTVGRGG